MGKQKHERYWVLFSSLWYIFIASKMQMKILDYQFLQKESYMQWQWVSKTESVFIWLIATWIWRVCDLLCRAQWVFTLSVVYVQDHEVLKVSIWFVKITGWFFSIFKAELSADIPNSVPA